MQAGSLQVFPRMQGLLRAPPTNNMPIGSGSPHLPCQVSCMSRDGQDSTYAEGSDLDVRNYMNINSLLN